MTTLAVPHSATSAALARHRLVDELAADGWPRAVAGDLGLVLTELVSNAVRHARPLDQDTIAVGWRERDRGLQVWVTDGGSVSERPEHHIAGPTEVGGRGLAIVDALSARWGVDYDGDVTTVWAEVELPVAEAMRRRRSG